MPPGVDAETVRRRAGLGQREPARTQGIAVVLGAGNIISIGPLDSIYQLFARQPRFRPQAQPAHRSAAAGVRARAGAARRPPSCLRIVTGGVEEGGRLIDDPRTSAVHMTGAAATHDAIVFGVGDEGAANQAAGRAILDKPVTSELGGGLTDDRRPRQWIGRGPPLPGGARRHPEAAQRRLQLRRFADPHRQLGLGAEGRLPRRACAPRFAERPARPAYYPGCATRDGRRPLLVSGRGGRRPAPDHQRPRPARRRRAGAPARSTSPRCSASPSLPGHGETFLRTAVDAANEKLMGTLGAQPHHRIPRRAQGSERGSSRRSPTLRYGTVAINAWTGVGYLTPRASWGASPATRRPTSRAASGVVHNALLLEAPERDGRARPVPAGAAVGRQR